MNIRMKRLLGLHEFYYYFFPLEDGENCEPRRFHVFRNLAKIGPYVKAFQLYTHIFSPCVTVRNTFSKV